MANRPNNQEEDFEAESEEEWELAMERKYRTAKRKHRNRDPEISELNLTAMMDMMTILLVYLLKSYNTNPVANLSPNLQPPTSTSKIEMKESTAIAISADGISVDDKPILKLINGEIPEEETSGAGAATEIVALRSVLDAEVLKMNTLSKQGMGPEFEGKALIIGDKQIPYRLLTSVLYTAGKAEYSQFQFVVLKQ